MAATQPTIADWEAARAELEQARDDLTDALSAHGEDSPEHAAALDRVAVATRKNAEVRRACAKAASRGFADAMANANSDNPQPDPFLQSLLADDAPATCVCGHYHPGRVAGDVAPCPAPGCSCQAYDAQRTGDADQDEPAVFVVIDRETDDDYARVLGQLRCLSADVVEYTDTDGGLRSAPNDCVSVVRVVY